MNLVKKQTATTTSMTLAHGTCAPAGLGHPSAASWPPLETPPPDLLPLPGLPFCPGFPDELQLDRKAGGDGEVLVLSI